MLALPEAVPLIVRHSSKHLVVHSLCLVAFKSIILCEMTVTWVPSRSSWALLRFTNSFAWGTFVLGKLQSASNYWPCCRKQCAKHTPEGLLGNPCIRAPHASIHLLSSSPRWICWILICWVRCTPPDGRIHVTMEKRQGKTVCLTHCLPRKLLQSNHNLG